MQSFTLKYIGYHDFESDDKANEYEIRYINPGDLKLEENRKYKVTFDVSEGTFKYEYTIKSIEN